MESVEKKKIRAELNFGLPGHESEYTFVPDSDRFISAEVSNVLEGELGDNWSVMNGGNRIEIRCKRPFGAQDDEKIRNAFQKAVGDAYNLKSSI